ncbi:MAG: iron-sulfur cluster repair di-iron protein [Chlorobi bacterium]|nr:iron-sulfur cluster repair di-iron protein [Chlorobiota bacterium]MCI0716414.1 iron-sulfur cluster repair di-iron protein [Chlorobiota bacterium]
MLVQKESKIGEIVSQNFQTAKVLDNFGIDFCCGGKKTLGDACREKGVNPEFVVSEISRIQDSNGSAARFDSWDVDFLIDFIVNNHHSYVLSSIPTIEHHLQKVISAHGERYPELAKIDEAFSDLKEELLTHMAKEEKMLFPYVKKMHIAYKNTLPPFGTISSPIKLMESEHEKAGKFMESINQLANSYFPPVDACTTFRVLYEELKEFERDLRIHIHLENNILFPKSAILEKELSKTYNIL